MATLQERADQARKDARIEYDRERADDLRHQAHQILGTPPSTTVYHAEHPDKMFILEDGCMFILSGGKLHQALHNYRLHQVWKIADVQSNNEWSLHEQPIDQHGLVCVNKWAGRWRRLDIKPVLVLGMWDLFVNYATDGKA
jgi:hypothetical protein